MGWGIYSTASWEELQSHITKGMEIREIDIAHVSLQLTVSWKVKMRMLAFYSVTVSNTFCSVSLKIKQ